MSRPEDVVAEELAAIRRLSAVGKTLLASEELDAIQHALAIALDRPADTSPTVLVLGILDRLAAAEVLLAQSVLIDRDSVVRLLTASSSWAELAGRCAKGYAPTLRAGHSDSPERAWLLHALRVEVLRAGHQVFPEPTVAELRAAGRDGGAR